MQLDFVTDADNLSSGRSCRTCAVAKSKCVRTAGRAICDRCNRLNKECHMRSAVPRRRKPAKVTRTAQLENLENKLESLVNAISTTQAQQRFAEAGGQLSPPISVTASDQNSAKCLTRSHEIIQSLCGGDRYGDQTESTSNATSTGPSPSDSYPVTVPMGSCGLSTPASFTNGSTSTHNAFPNISMDEAEMLVNRYRRLMMPSCPFVIIGPYELAMDMRAKRPFLLHAVVTFASYHDFSRQKILLQGFMRDVSERMLIDSEKSIDLLQGLVVAIAFYHAHIFTTMQLTNLLGLSMSLISDLGLNRGPGMCHTPDMDKYKDKSTKDGNPGATAKQQHSLEEHRALAGIFYQSSMLYSMFERTSEALKFTKHLEDALQILEDTHEHDSDIFLVQLVRIQHLMERIDNTDFGQAPIHLHVRLFEQELAALKAAPAALTSYDPNHQLQLQTLSADAMIHELAMSSETPSTSHPTPQSQHTYLNALYASSAAFNAFNAAFFAIPAVQYLTLPFSVFGQFAHTFISMTKLASQDFPPGPETRELFSESVDFVNVIEKAAHRFEEATKAAPDTEVVRNDSFAKWAHRIRWMRGVYEAKFKAGDRNENGGGGDGDQVSSNMMPTPTEAGAHQQQQQQQQQQTFVSVPSHVGAGVADAAAMYNAPASMPFSQNNNSNNNNMAPDPTDVLNADFFNYLDEGFWQSFSGDFDLGFGSANAGEGMQMG